MQRGRESHSTGEDTNEWFPISTLSLQGERLTFDEFVYGCGVFPHQEYLESIHQLHEDWLMKRMSFPLPAPVLVSDEYGAVASSCIRLILCITVFCVLCYEASSVYPRYT